MRRKKEEIETKLKFLKNLLSMFEEIQHEIIKDIKHLNEELLILNLQNYLREKGQTGIKISKKLRKVNGLISKFEDVMSNSEDVIESLTSMTMANTGFTVDEANKILNKVFDTEDFQYDLKISYNYITNVYLKTDIPYSNPVFFVYLDTCGAFFQNSESSYLFCEGFLDFETTKALKNIIESYGIASIIYEEYVGALEKEDYDKILEIINSNEIIYKLEEAISIFKKEHIDEIIEKVNKIEEYLDISSFRNDVLIIEKTNII